MPSTTYLKTATTAESKILKEISPLRDKLFLNSCIKELSENLITINFSDNHWTKVIPKSFGVYLFWANINNFNNDLKALKNEWEMAKKEVKCSSRFNQKRANALDNKWINSGKIPLYLGKAENLHNRIDQHTFIGASKGTYALKLKALRDTNESLGDINFYVSYLVLPFSKNGSFLLEIIESSLRNILNPVIGKQ